MRSGPRALRIYSTSNGRRPFEEWIDSLKDQTAQARILVRLERVRLGNLGDCKPVGEGVSELRIDVGPGYRVYLGEDGDSIVICCAAGARRRSRETSLERKDIGGITGTERMPRSVPYDDFLIESLKKHRRAEAYLKAALEEDDPRVFLLALRNVAQARGISKVAAKSKLNRESLYKMLSRRGNPGLRSLGALLDSLGFRLTVESKDAA